MANCISPFRKKQDGQFIMCPCGYCPNCLSRRLNGWSFRLYQEERNSVSSSFVTLTYSDENLTYGESEPSLVKKDLQLFFKRLRKAHGKSSIRYFAVGEYGTKRKRPHYHILLFNANESLVEKAWGLGSVHFGKVQLASINYCLAYMMKTHAVKKPEGKAPEFQLFSKGLGCHYLKDGTIKYHKDSLSNFLVLPNGTKVCLPRYFRNKIFDDDEWNSIKTKYIREAKVVDHLEPEFVEARSAFIDRFIRKSELRSKF